MAETAPKKDIKHKPIEITITMPTQAYFLSGIRDFTLNLIKNMTDFTEQWAYRFQSIVDELCNNAIEHGSKEGDMITIHFFSDPNKYIQISVEDQGHSDQHLSAAEIQKLIDERRRDQSLYTLIRGRGLPKIVAEWTDELKFEDTETGGIKVTVKKSLHDEQLNKPSPQNLEKPAHIMLN